MAIIVTRQVNITFVLSKRVGLCRHGGFRHGITRSASRLSVMTRALTRNFSTTTVHIHRSLRAQEFSARFDENEYGHVTNYYHITVKRGTGLQSGS